MFVPFVLRKIRKSEAFLEVFFIGSRIGIIDFLPLSDSLCNTSLFLITKKLHGCILKPVGAYLAQSIRNCISPSDTTSSLYSRTHRLVLIISIMSFKITHTYSNRLDLSYSFLNLNFLIAISCTPLNCFSFQCVYVWMLVLQDRSRMNP